MGIFIIILTLICSIILATAITNLFQVIKMNKPISQNEEGTDTSLYDDFDIQDICDNLERRDRTQFDFLLTLAKNVATHNNSTVDTIQTLETFCVPCIKQAISTIYPDIPQNTKQDMIFSFVNKCATNCRDSGHLNILKLTIKYLMNLDFVVNKGQIKIDKSNIKDMISLGIMTAEFSKTVANAYISNISYVHEIIETFGTEQDLQNFDTWIKKHEETGKWDWKFFSSANLGTVFWTGLKILENKNKTKLRLEQIKQTIRTNNPIDKSITKTLRMSKQTGLIIIYSKFMKCIFWLLIAILVLVIVNNG